VLVSRNGPQAVDAVTERGGAIDIVLDLIMPEMDGDG